MTDDDVWERSMRLAEAANMDPMHGEPVPGRDFPEERRPTPPGWAQPILMAFGMLVLLPIEAVRALFRRIFQGSSR